MATDRALVTTDRRLAWVDVAHARWVDDDSTLTVEAGRPRPPGLARLPEPGRLPETVHERVMASIVVTRRVPVPGGAVRVVGRDGGDGELRWQVIADPGVDGRLPTYVRPRTPPSPRCARSWAADRQAALAVRRDAALTGRRISRSTAASICPWVAGWPKLASAPSRSSDRWIVTPSS